MSTMGAGHAHARSPATCTAPLGIPPDYALRTARRGGLRPGPGFQDARPRGFFYARSACVRRPESNWMPKRTDISSILIIGAGPIVIGQACEFDYSGTQACKALKAEGYRIVLVNSNPA